jgi:hypothetical protein
MIVGLFGIMFSTAAKQTTSLPLIVFATNGVATTQAFDTSIVLSEWKAFATEGQVYSPDLQSVAPERSSIRVYVDVHRGDDLYLASAWAYFYANYGPVAQPVVLHTLQGDIYLHLEVTDELYNSLLQAYMGITTSIPQTASLTVSTVPMIYLLWAGVAVMCIGIGLNVLADSKKPNEKWQDNFL